MKSHLFGAVSSPSCANYALQQTARDFGRYQSAKVSLPIDRNFYVDDALVSSASEEDAIRLALGLKELCAKGGFRLTKFSSNSIAVLQAIPKEDQAASVRNLELGSDSLPADRALGVHWDVETDTLGCQVNVESFQKRPITRRGMLSATASFYDPFGIASPCVIRARMLQQDLTRLRLGWDERVPLKYSKAWNKWLQDLHLLAQYRIPRMVCAGSLSAAVCLELHHFSDASERGYGVVSYLRAISSEGQISCGFLLSKAHLTPIKPITIPRLELTAATLAVKVNLETQRALDFPIRRAYFWTDSTTVLKYIRNRKTRFHVFVANRLAAIHDASSSNQWFWVPSQENPADLVSRGMDAAKFVENALWKSGPSFLWNQPENWPQLPELSDCKETDPEVKVALTATTSSPSEASDPTSRLIRHYSSWSRLLRAVAWIQRVLARLKNKRQSFVPSDLQVSDIERAEEHIIRYVQATHFPAEINALEAGKTVRLTSPIVSLDPKLENGALRVGGRLTNANIDYAHKYPLILPSKDSVVDMIIDDAHEKAGHEGRQYVMKEVRAKYWILKANSAVRRRLRQCLSCRKRIRPAERQKMADLPLDRVQSGEKPFTNTGVDFFGPFFTKRGRAQAKTYGVIFTCLAIRAVHIEVAASLSTDSFMCALRRFIARRGEVRMIRSDNGSNFVGTNRELKREVDHLLDNNSYIARQTLARGIEWRFNPPGASHFGGAWERMIRSVRKILNGLLTSQTFTEETLRTLLCEVECIINNRPLTPVSADPRDQVPLTPNHLLVLRCVSLPASQTVEDLDLHGKKNWRQASYLANQFWRRWRLEYIPLLQTRAGPVTRSRDNVKVGDVVLVVDDSVPRGTWPLGLVEDVRTSDDAKVRAAKVRCRGTTFWRPVTKLVKITEVRS